MKGALLTAAVLLGSAQAGVHKMKLKKIPLSEQLVSIAIRQTAQLYADCLQRAGIDGGGVFKEFLTSLVNLASD